MENRPKLLPNCPLPDTSLSSRGGGRWPTHPRMSGKKTDLMSPCRTDHGWGVDWRKEFGKGHRRYVGPAT